jgi:hypothetical protein
MIIFNKQHIYKKAEIIANAPEGAQFYTLNGDYYARHKNFAMSVMTKYNPLNKKFSMVSANNLPDMLKLPHAENV